MLVKLDIFYLGTRGKLLEFLSHHFNTVYLPSKKRAMRLISFNELCSPPPLFEILKIFDLVKVLNIMFVHQFLNSNIPVDLLNYFKF